MKLLTKELIDQLPVCDQVCEDPDPTIYAKFFLPGTIWTWYVAAVESRDDDDLIFFGYVIGDFPEWGHFSLSELRSARVNVPVVPAQPGQGDAFTIPCVVERDLHFTQGCWSEVKKRERIED